MWSASWSVGGRVCEPSSAWSCVPAADRQRVADDQPAGRRQPGRLEHVRPGLVAAGQRARPTPYGPTRNAPARRSSSAPNTLGESKPRQAQPFDAPVGRDQRAGVAVRQERVVGDRRERRTAGQRTVMGRQRDRWRHCWLSLTESSAAQAGHPKTQVSELKFGRCSVCSQLSTVMFNCVNSPVQIRMPIPTRITPPVPITSG